METFLSKDLNTSCLDANSRQSKEKESSMISGNLKEICRDLKLLLGLNLTLNLRVVVIIPMTGFFYLFLFATYIPFISMIT